jgi:hypothetical protein
MCSVVEIKNLDEYCIRYHSPESLESLDHLVKDRIKVVDINIGDEEEEEDELIHPLFRRRWDQQNDEEDEHLLEVRSPVAAETKNLANNDDIQLETSSRQSASMSKLGDTLSTVDKQSADAKENGRKPSVIPQPMSKVSEVQKEETQSYPSPLSGSEESTVLRTRVKSVVEMMTTLSSPTSSDREAGERRHTIQQVPSLAANAVAVPSSALESPTPDMMKGAASTTVVTKDSKAKSMAQRRDPALPASLGNFDGDAVPAKPPRLLATTAHHELESETTERQKNVVRSSTASNSVNSSSKTCSRSLSLVDSSCKASRSLSLVDSSTSPYSSEPEDQGGGDDTYVWPSPDQFTGRLNGDGLANKDDGDEGGTGFNGGEKWSYVSGTYRCSQYSVLYGEIKRRRHKQKSSLKV